MKRIKHHHRLFFCALVLAAVTLAILINFLGVAYPSLEQVNQTTQASG